MKPERFFFGNRAKNSKKFKNTYYANGILPYIKLIKKMIAN